MIQITILKKIIFENVNNTDFIFDKTEERKFANG